MPELPRKLPAKGIAILFGVSEQRISQLKRKGQLNPDSTNLYDVQEAMQLRGFQMSEHGVRVIGQQYGNGTTHVAPAKINPVNDVPAMSAEDAEALGIEVDIRTVAPSPNSTLAAQSRVGDLREKKLRIEIDRAETRARREAGVLVESAAVHTAFVKAGATVAGLLQNLPDTLAALIPDPEAKAEVRATVRSQIDRIQHALFTVLKDLGQDDA